jgi:transposase InsO family protein
MQIRHLPRQIIRNARRASRLLDAKSPSNVAASRRDALARWRQARRDGLTAAAAAKAIATPLATLYRWQKQLEPKSTRPHKLRKPKTDTKLVLAVEKLRKTYPMWGKDTLAPLLWKQGFDCSVSSVGRIIAKLVARGVVDAVPALRKGTRHAPRKHKRTYAKRKPKDVEAKLPGDIVQVDTVHINLAPGKAIRHFTAYCPIAKWTVAEARNRATATAAALFLDKIATDMPFKVKAIQVDGGSEFMADFEAECQRRKIDLYVLPPRSPKLNGGVERCNGAWRYEFYACTELPASVEALNPLIDDWQDTYNFIRPHRALSGLTPAEYMTRKTATGTPPPSHMS